MRPLPQITVATAVDADDSVDISSARVGDHEMGQVRSLLSQLIAAAAPF